MRQKSKSNLMQMLHTYMRLNKLSQGSKINKYAPHQGPRECERRVRQGKAGEGVVKLAHERLCS